VLEQPGTLMVFKLVKKETLPLNSVKEEIIQTISNDKLDAAAKALNDSVQTDLDPSYFGPPPSVSAGAKSSGMEWKPSGKGASAASDRR